MNARAILITAAVGVMPLVSGCIMIPIATHDDIIMAGHAPSTNAVAEVRTNLTDKAMVLEGFGQPAAIWEDERIFLYWWDARWGKVYWVFGVAPAGGGTAAAGGAGVCDVPRPYTLYVQFDDQDRVQRIERVVRSSTASPGTQLRKWANDGKTGSTSEPPPLPQKKNTLLFRIIATGGDKSLQEATRSWLSKPNIFGPSTLVAGLGTFHTGGVPERRSPKCAEPDAGQTGWFYYELEPGTYYIGLQDHQSFQRLDATQSHTSLRFAHFVDGGLILRANVSGDEEIIYGGTVRLECSVTKGSATGVNPWLARVEDESAAAAQIASNLKPGATLKTNLLKPHSGPYILRTPGTDR